MNDIIFRYKNGRIIPIKVNNSQTTSEYMNDKIRDNNKYKVADIDKYENESQDILNKLTTEEKSAISNYVGIGHDEINQTLKHGKPKNEYIYSGIQDIQKDIKYIDNAMDKSKLKENIITWRGTYENFDNYKIGDIIKMKSYTSTSLNKNIALRWAKNKGDGGVMLEIKTPKNTKAIYLSDNFSSQNERELLLNRNLKYKILGKKKEKNIDYGNYMKYILEVVE